MATERTPDMISTQGSKLCRSCEFKFGIGGATTTDVCCAYLLITGKRRGCPVGWCNKYKKGKKKKINKKFVEG